MISRLLLLALTLVIQTVWADDVSGERFYQKYRTFLQQENQTPLPLPQIEKQDWKKLQANQTLEVVFKLPDMFYLNKTFAFTIYQSKENGSYFLDAAGGFWGMEELVYGPLIKSDLQ